MYNYIVGVVTLTAVQTSHIYYGLSCLWALLASVNFTLTSLWCFWHSRDFLFS